MGRAWEGRGSVRPGPRGHVKNGKIKPKKPDFGDGLSGWAKLRAMEHAGRAVDGGGSVHHRPDIPDQAFRTNKLGRTRTGSGQLTRLTPLGEGRVD